MDDRDHRQLAARRALNAERALRVRAEHDLRMAQNEIRQLRHIVAVLRRRLDAQTKGGTDDAAAA